MSSSISALTQRISAIDEVLTIGISASNVRDAATQAAAALLEELVSNSRTVTLQWRRDPRADGVIIALEKNATVGPVSFWGAPTGFELEGLVYALECLGRTSMTLDVSTSICQLIKPIHRTLRSDLYVTPT
ncbi:MAG: hypothetical protein C7B45_16915 [Sulfobacillus acidophilus]|uniref:Uncharacterized protein n=1 Tax=Sulfobacillus acidophilus TaxID=53633 RepID=A0A2T2WCS6_9FIRM|nr:MAG: hypothetical protein C7B45_16915 [Sulfobacillus acidophilus]